MSGRTTNPAKPRVRPSGRTDVVQGEPGRTMSDAKPTKAASGPASIYDLLLLAADVLDDLERARIANENRLRSLTRPTGAYGKGASAMLPEVQSLTQIVETLRAAEHQAELQLRRLLRETPLADWQRRTVGIGERQLARLLALIGDPADRPNPAKLIAYCALHVIDGAAPRRKDGVKANWRAKTRALLLAESCIKHPNSPYRPVYDRGREACKDRVHDRRCQNTKYLAPSARSSGRASTNGCGTREHPEWGEIGSPWRPGHQHRHALRVVAKAILRDMWAESRRARANEGAEPAGAPLEPHAEVA
jgi:hypothetical protein